MHDLDTRFRPSPKSMALLRNTAAFFALVFIVGLFLDPRRAWSGYLMGFMFFTGFSLSGAVCLSVYYLTGARWGAALRRIPEAMMGTLPYAAVMGIVFLLGVPSLYEWAHPSVVEASPLLQHKAAWLNVPFFCIRTVIYFAVWIWASRRLLNEIRAQETDGDRIHTTRNVWNGALFMALFAVTFSLASIDWIESLEPEWFSTIFALVTSSGIMTSGLALIMIVAVLMRWSPSLPGLITRNHLDDLGKITMSFSLFWVYIWFCQYMLIWYTDIPEETTYYVLRSQGGWEVFTPVNIILNFAIPFLVLMPKRFRRRGPVLLRVAIILLVGRLVDLYWQIMPPLFPDGPTLGLWEFAPVLAILAFFIVVFQHKLSETSLIPDRDPWLPLSLSYHC